MRIKRGLLSLIAAILGTSSLLILTTGTSFATTSTLTWTGTDCNSGGSCDWSDKNNWNVTDFVGTFTTGTFPSSSSLNLVFPNSATTDAPVVDQVDTVGSITFTGNSGGGAEIDLSDGLTVDSSIAQDSTDTTATDGIGGTSSAETLTLGGDVTITINAGIDFENNAGDTDIMALGSNTLTVNNTSSSQGGVYENDDTVTGSGATINYDLTNDELANVQIGVANTYSGTTNILGQTDVDETSDVNAFGTSAIVVSSGAQVDFNVSSSTISNDITVDGTSDDSPVTSLDFSNALSNVTTLNVPNVVLEGDTRFANDTVSPNFMTINLAGINANGNCIEYLGGTDNSTEAGAGFENGPDFCVFDTGASAPKTPDTGAKLASNQSVLTILGATLVASALVATVVIFRKKSQVKN